MTTKPLVSVLMASYNNGRFIEEAVSSVMAQTYRNWELIVVDDASTDDSWTVITKLARSEPRIRSESTVVNVGVGATKRKCVNISAGQVCAILDPDDALMADSLSLAVEAHATHPDCAVVSSEHHLCDSELKQEGRSIRHQGAEHGRSHLEGFPDTVHALWSFKRSNYLQTTGFSPSYRLAEDKDLIYKLEETGGLFHVDLPLYRYRIHKGGISTNDRMALASSWGIRAMMDALSRRRGRIAALQYRRESRVVAQRIKSFLEWSYGLVDPSTVRRHVIDLLRLKPASIGDRTLLRSVRWLLRQSRNLMSTPSPCDRPRLTKGVGR